MDENRYAGLATQAPDPNESLYDGLMRVFRTIFEPWERHPDMLRAYYRARFAPGGQRLVSRGLDAVVPAAMAVLAEAEPDLVADLPNRVQPRLRPGGAFCRRRDRHHRDLVDAGSRAVSPDIGPRAAGFEARQPLEAVLQTPAGNPFGEVATVRETPTNRRDGRSPHV